MPELATLARVVLNHASESMTRNYRTTAKQLTASRRVAKHLESAERELERRVRRQRRRSPLDRASRKRKPGRLRRAADQPTPRSEERWGGKGGGGPGRAWGGRGKERK